MIFVGIADDDSCNRISRVWEGVRGRGQRGTRLWRNNRNSPNRVGVVTVGRVDRFFLNFTVSLLCIYIGCVCVHACVRAICMHACACM